MNWKTKVAIQSALAHLPGGESLNHQLQWMNGRYAPERLKGRLLEQASKLAKVAPYVKDGVIVEVGTGWELIAPMLFHLMGAEYIYTYDHLAHLRMEIPRIVLSQMDAEELSSVLGIDPSTLHQRIERLKNAADSGVLLPLAGIFYRAPSDACNTGLPAHSVDLFFSYEVLEHVPESVLDGLILESKRILKPSGLAYHAIEPGDHYMRDVSHVNHYRYPEWLWRVLVKNSISYHNRLTERQFVEAFERHGAEIIHREMQTAESDLVNLRNGFKRDARFSAFSAEELAAWYSEIIYRFPY